MIFYFFSDFVSKAKNWKLSAKPKNTFWKHWNCKWCTEYIFYSKLRTVYVWTYGIYHISVYITTNSHKSRYFVLKNGQRFAEAFVSFESYFQTGTTTFVTSMNVGDKFELAADPTLYVYGIYESGITIMQIHWC